MLGAEEDGAEDADDVRDAGNFDLIMLDVPTTPLHHTDGDVLLTAEVREIDRDLGAIGTEADHFLLVDGTEAFADGGKADGLEEIGFSLGVCADEDIDAWIEGDVGVFDIAKITDSDPIAFHAPFSL